MATISTTVTTTSAPISDDTTIRVLLTQIGKEEFEDTDMSPYIQILESNLVIKVGKIRSATKESWTKWNLPTALEESLKKRLGLNVHTQAPIATNTTTTSTAMERQPPGVLTFEAQNNVWSYLVQLNIDNQARGTGILIQSNTNANKRHIIVSLHTFLDNKGEALPGFPHNKKHLIQQRKIEGKDQSDSLSISISQLKGPQENKELQIVSEQVLGEQDILHVDVDNDVLVIFDIEIPGSACAPVSQEMVCTMRVHLFGFGNLQGFTYFVTDGSVSSIQGSTFVVSCNSARGMSGGAVVCDVTGGVIGYSGGALSETDASPMGAYAFVLSHVVYMLQSKDIETNPDHSKRRKKRKS